MSGRIGFFPFHSNFGFNSNFSLFLIPANQFIAPKHSWFAEFKLKWNEPKWNGLPLWFDVSCSSWIQSKLLNLKVFLSFIEHATAMLTSNYCCNNETKAGIKLNLQINQTKFIDSIKFLWLIQFICWLIKIVWWTGLVSAICRQSFRLHLSEIPV